MRFNFRLGFLALAVTGLSVIATAQVPYDTPCFTAAFNGPVTHKSLPIDNGDYDVYSSQDSDAGEQISSTHMWTWVKDAPKWKTNYSTTHRLRSIAAGQPNTNLITSENADFKYQGFAASYGLFEEVNNGQTIWTRTRYIVVTKFTIIVLTFYATKEYAQSPAGDSEFLRFANSLVIKKGC